MINYEILSIEPTGLGQYWVITYKTAESAIKKESIEALDSHEASIKFRNQMIREAKSQ